MCTQKCTQAQDVTSKTLYLYGLVGLCSDQVQNIE